MLSHKHTITFKDGKSVNIDREELYPEQIVDSIISTAFDGKVTDKDIPIVSQINMVKTT